MIEPLYCEGCGDEIGPEHRSECDFDNPYDDRDKVRYCHLCGVSSDVGVCRVCDDMLKAQHEQRKVQRSSPVCDALMGKRSKRRT